MMHETPEFTVGSRVKHRWQTGRYGTVVESEQGNGIRIDWDLIYGETLEQAHDLEPDAPMPDPAFALAKALRYRHQRDAALTDLANLVGIEASYAAKFGEQGRALDDARAEYLLHVAGADKRAAAFKERWLDLIAVWEVAYRDGTGADLYLDEGMARLKAASEPGAVVTRRELIR